jgi:Transposase DDE domain
MKNISLDSKDITLFSVLKSHFKGLNLPRIHFISLFIAALCKVKSINYDRLASGFDTKSVKNSSYRRIQRFMAKFDLPMCMVSSLIFSLLPKKENLILVLDRTNWKFGTSNINILMLGVSYKNVAVPLMFTMLDKRGNSSTQERIDLINTYLDWFGVHTIDCLLADREFIGDEWLEFLNRKKIRYYIRIRNNFKVFSYQKRKEIPVTWLFNSLRINQFYHYPKIVELHKQRCYLSAKKVSTQAKKVELLILVSFNKPDQAMIYYKQRWQIETLFKAMKSSGFNIEQTHVTDLLRLERLFLLTMIAFIWCYKIGDYLDTEIEKIKIKTHQRRAVSVFKYGLDWLSKYLLTKFQKVEINLYQFLSCT